MTSNKLEVKISDWYGLHKVKTFSFNQGVTCLIGKNGAGKSTLLHELKEALGEKNIFYYDNDDSERNALSKFSFYGDLDKMCRNMGSSEGQNIRNNFEDAVPRLGGYVRKRLEDKNGKQQIIILLDGLDSGISIDYIKTLKEDLFDLVLEDCNKSGLECYIILAANNFEFCEGQDCVDVSTGKHMRFEDYYKFREFYLGRRKKDESKE